MNFIGLYLKFAYLISVFLKVVSAQCEYHGGFSLKFFGKLSTNGFQTLFTAEGKTLGQALQKCSKFCTSDQRCVGIELCELNLDLFQCRVCCEWKKLGYGYIDEQPGCKYLEMANTVDFNKCYLFA